MPLLEYSNRTVADRSGGKRSDRSKWISAKIGKLIREEHKTPKQAAGQAYGMWDHKK